MEDITCQEWGREAEPCHPTKGRKKAHYSKFFFAERRERENSAKKEDTVVSMAINGVKCTS